MEEAQINLDSHYRLGSIDLKDRFTAIEKYSTLIQSWKSNCQRELGEPKSGFIYFILFISWGEGKGAASSLLTLMPFFLVLLTLVFVT